MRNRIASWSLPAVLLLTCLCARGGYAADAGITAEAIADKLSLQYQPLKDADGALRGARLSGAHKVLILVGLKSVSVDDKGLLLAEAARVEGEHVVLPADALARLQEALNLPPTTSEAGDDGREERAGSAGQRTVVLDPGHGGNDPGAPAHRYNLDEKEINLDVSLRAAALLRAAGVKVYLTRKDDRTLELNDRTALANEVAPDLFVSVHANASRNRSLSGYMVLYPADDQSHGAVAKKAIDATDDKGVLQVAGVPGPLPEAARRALSMALMQEYHRRSADAAACISAAFRDIVGTEQHGPLADFRGLYVLRATHCPAVLVEVEFLSNPSGEERLRQSEFRDRLARAVTRGVLAFLKRNPAGKSQ